MTRCISALVFPTGSTAVCISEFNLALQDGPRQQLSPGQKVGDAMQFAPPSGRRSEASGPGSPHLGAQLSNGQHVGDRWNSASSATLRGSTNENSSPHRRNWREDERSAPNRHGVVTPRCTVAYIVQGSIVLILHIQHAKYAVRCC